MPSIFEEVDIGGDGVPDMVYYICLRDFEQRVIFDRAMERHSEFKWIESTGGQMIYEATGSFSDFKRVALNIAEALKLEIVRLERMVDPGLGLLH